MQVEINWEKEKFICKMKIYKVLGTYRDTTIREDTKYYITYEKCVSEDKNGDTHLYKNSKDIHHTHAYHLEPIYKIVKLRSHYHILL